MDRIRYIAKYYNLPVEEVRKNIGAYDNTVGNAMYGFYRLGKVLRKSLLRDVKRGEEKVVKKLGLERIVEGYKKSKKKVKLTVDGKRIL